MSLLESKINSIAAIAVDAALNSARLDYVNQTFYSKSDAVSALSSKQKSIVLAPATITLGQSADYTYFVDTNSYSYPLFASQDIVWRKNSNNISLSISDDFKNAYLSTAAAASLYARADEISTFETTRSLFNNIYQAKVDMGGYITSGSLTAYQTKVDMSDYITGGSIANTLTTFTPLSGTYLSILDASTTLSSYLTSSGATHIYQTKENMSSYVTIGTLINNYATQLDISTKVEQSYFENQVATEKQSAINNSRAYTDDQINGLSSVYQPLGNYLTDSSVFQLSGNYLTNASLFQLSGNYLTNASLFQASGNYLTDASVFQLSGNYLTNASLFQNAGNYLTDSSVFQLSGNYITSGSLTAYAPISNPTFSGVVVAPAITLGGNDISSSYMTKPWVAGRFDKFLTIIKSSGQQPFTLTKTSTGIYNVNWTSANPNGTNYSIILSIRGAATISYGIPTANAFQLYCYPVGASSYIDLPQDCSFMAF